MPAAIFKHEHRVAYAECTLGNHVYHARYLDFLERARGEFFRRLDAPFLQLQDADTVFPVIECRLRYKAPARYDDVLTIELWLTDAERARLNFTYRVLNRENRIILEAETLHVCAGVGGKPKRVPDDLLVKLQPYLRPNDGPSR